MDNFVLFLSKIIQPMQTKYCLIIEDSEVCIDTLTAYLKKLPFFQIVGICKTYAEVVSYLSVHKNIDLIFLDISLAGEDLTGLDILRTIPKLPPVIINTSHTEFAVESYRIGKAADYLVKPYDFDRFLIAVNRALDIKIGTKELIFEDHIFLKKGRKFQRFDYSDIHYFEAYGIYVKVCTSEGIQTVNETISNLDEKLDSAWFVRVHKSFTINIQKITGFDHNFIFLESEKIPIGASYKADLEGLLRLFNKN